MTKNDLTTHAKIDASALREFEPHHFFADASELRLPPGTAWPMALAPQPPVGNGNEFYINRTSADKAVYLQLFGCQRITVFND